MSRPSFVIKGYVGAATRLINAYLFVPVKLIDLAPNPAGGELIVGKISSGLSAISFAALYTYYYDLYYDEYIKSDNLFVKWLIYALITIHIAAIGICLFFLLKQDKKLDKAGILFSKIVLPILTAGMGICHLVILLATGCKNVTASKIFNIINSILATTDFLLIDQALKKRPEIYTGTHAVRAILMLLEAESLFFDMIQDELGDSQQEQVQPVLG